MITKYFEYDDREIAIRFDGVSPLTIGNELIQDILALTNTYRFNLAVLSVGRSYELQLADGAEIVQLFWSTIGQCWDEIHLAA
jgi:hypothetical protein